MNSTIMTFAIFIWILLCCSYCLILWKLKRGVSRLKPGLSNDTPFVSVVVAARDEADNIQNCLTALSVQDYPKDNVEFIIVDDRSEDNTPVLIQTFSQKDRRFKSITIRETPSHFASKKWALKTGIEASKGSIILTTDADCLPPAGWISSIIRYFDKKVGLVAGYAPLNAIEHPTFLQRLIQLDALALASVAAGSFGAGFPLTCSGRNLGYRRQVYEDIGGFESLSRFVSGDDDLLLHRIRKNTSWKMRYAADPDASVSSAPPSTLSAFFHQRTRHASKGFHYPLYLILSLIGVYLLNLTLILGVFFIELWPFWLTIITLKSIFEFIFIKSVAKKVRGLKLLKYFPLTILPHIFYVVFFGLWGQIGRFRWKGTSTQKHINASV